MNKYPIQWNSDKINPDNEKSRLRLMPDLSAFDMGDGGLCVN
jgi:hypothetical protein